MKYWQIIAQSYVGYLNYLIRELREPRLQSYFWYLLLISVLVYICELIHPWRVHQARIRRDFWLDGFYMFFNFFLFSLLGFAALSNVASELWLDAWRGLGARPFVLLNLSGWPTLVQLVFYFFLKDFVQWNIHRLLHKVPWLWRFHQVHHSVREMGFSAHLRYHFGETIIYKLIQFIPLSLLGISVVDFFVLDAIAIAIGHLNHSNLYLTWGPLRWLLNSPAMHIWHHAKNLPPERLAQAGGVNFGLSLSLWDYLFGTAYLPSDGRDLRLGFPGDEAFPAGFFAQLWPPPPATGEADGTIKQHNQR